MSPDVLAQENEQLRKQLAEREERIAERDERIAQLESQLDLLANKLRLTAKERLLLEQKLRQLQELRRRHPFLVSGQGLLAFDAEATATEADEQPEHVGEAPDGETPDDSIRLRHKPKQPARKIDTSNLPVEHVYHELAPEQRVCATTGKELVAVGEKVEEEIRFDPGVIKRVLHHRLVYGLSEEDARERQAPQVTAPGPVRPLEGSIAGASLLAWILVQKYARHLPLYRQEAILAQHGLHIPRQTTCDWVLGAAYQLARSSRRCGARSWPRVSCSSMTPRCSASSARGRDTSWPTCGPRSARWPRECCTTSARAAGTSTSSRSCRASTTA